MTTTTAESALVLAQTSAGITTLTLNRGSRFNALSTAMIAAPVRKRLSRHSSSAGNSRPLCQMRLETR